MISVSRRLSFLKVKHWFRGFYAAPEPFPFSWAFWVASAIVTLIVLAFCLFFTVYLFARHDTFQTNAEDFGIMNQAIWSATHGQLFHQTICNTIFDTNCVSPNGVSRFAIHFEPILFPISFLYTLWPDPHFLLLLQTVIVACGAYPAFWLARLRLRSNSAGVVFALFYLLYPAQQQATVFDFHAVTFTASLLLFLLYFMYTRRTLWTFVFALLAMGCKEEIPLVVATFGLWSIIFQQRVRSGLFLLFVGTIWFVIGFFVIMPHFSPTGHPLLISRYVQLGSPLHFFYSAIRHPHVFLEHYIFEPAHSDYINTLFMPAGHLSFGKFHLYLPFLAPWILVMALPSLALNLLSSDAQMYSGLFQYNAEIVPVIVFSAIEACVVILWLVRLLTGCLIQLRPWYSSKPFVKIWSFHISGAFVRSLVLSFLLLGMLLNVLRADYYFHGQMPLAAGFQWPVTTEHTQLAQHFIALVPADTSVSAQTRLVPHLSQREHIYLFPYGAVIADYILLDINGDFYPYGSYESYLDGVKQVWMSGNYGILSAQDGYLLLKHGLSAPTMAFDPELLTALRIGPVLSIPSKPQSFSNITALTSVSMVRWSVKSLSYLLPLCTFPNGLAHMVDAVLPQVQSSSTIMNVLARLPLRFMNASGTSQST